MAKLFQRLRHSRKARLAATPILVIIAAFAVTLAAQAASDPASAGYTGASSVKPSIKQEKKPMQSDSADKNTQGADAAGSKTESVKDDGSGSTTNVTVNGESITVPENGSYRRSTVDGGTKTEIGVDSRNKSTTSGNGASNSSSTSITFDTQSSSTSESSSR